MPANCKSGTEACVLAGGMATRMGCEKGGLDFHGKTLLEVARETVKSAGFKCRVVERDVVPRCGPLGGIITAMRKTQANRILFLSCAMPFVTAGLLARMDGEQADHVFAESEGRVGFPFVISVGLEGVRETIEAQHAAGNFSIQSLAAALSAARLAVPKEMLFNINTPTDLEAALKRRA